MKEQLISFELAKLAQKSGFVIPCAHVVNKSSYNSSVNFTGETTFSIEDIDNAIFNTSKEHYLAPTQSLLQKWLREKYNIIVLVEIFNIGDLKDDEFCYQYSIYDKLDDDDNIHISINTYQSYEEALEKGLYSALKFI